MLEQDISIIIIATDRHRGVGALMKSDCSHISHQYDVWHMAKCVVKQLTQKGKLKHGSYRGSSQFLITCGGLHKHVMEMHKFLLKSGHNILYHVSNVHELNGGKDSKFSKCVHLTLPIEEQHSKND